MSYNEIHLALMRQGVENGGVIKLGAPEADAEYEAFHERVEALRELDAWGIVRCHVQPDHMHAKRSYYLATATFTDEGREEAERLFHGLG
jgi:hypothetical protein